MSDPESGQRAELDDYQRAIDSMDTFIDVSVADLMTLARRAEEFAQRRLRQALTVARVMSQPARCIHPQTTLSAAAHLMISERISGLPVIDHDERLCGIITEADFLRALGVTTPHQQPNLWQTLETLYNHLTQHATLEAPDDPASAHMAKDVVSASPDQDLHDVLELMQRHRVKRVVVCDAERRVLGMLTRSDLVRVFFDRYQ